MPDRDKTPGKLGRNGGIAFMFVALANLPDWPLPGWGHDSYDISHSVFVNIALICVAVFAVKILASSKWFGRGRFLSLAALAWLSHLLLDSFYNHGQGIAIYWPVSTCKLNLAMPWFGNWDLSQSVLSTHNLSVFGIEFIAYSPILLAAIVLSNKVSKRREPNEA